MRFGRGVFLATTVRTDARRRSTTDRNSELRSSRLAASKDEPRRNRTRSDIGADRVPREISIRGARFKRGYCQTVFFFISRFYPPPIPRASVAVCAHTRVFNTRTRYIIIITTTITTICVTCHRLQHYARALARVSAAHNKLIRTTAAIRDCSVRASTATITRDASAEGPTSSLQTAVWCDGRLPYAALDVRFRLESQSYGTNARNVFFFFVYDIHE